MEVIALCVNFTLSVTSGRFLKCLLYVSVHLCYIRNQRYIRNNLLFKLYYNLINMVFIVFLVAEKHITILTGP